MAIPNLGHGIGLDRDGIIIGGTAPGAGNLEEIPEVADTKTTVNTTITISATIQAFSSGGGQGSVNVSGGASCGWASTSNVPWISVTGGANGTGNGTASFTVASNADNTARTGTLVIAGQVFTVTQEAAAPAPTPTPTSTPATAGLSSSTYTVNEGDATGVALITVNRGGDTTAALTVDCVTSDTSGMTPCQTNQNGIASERCDYVTAVGALRFAAGELSKTIQVPILNDAYQELSETFTSL